MVRFLFGNPFFYQDVSQVSAWNVDTSKLSLPFGAEKCSDLC